MPQIKHYVWLIILVVFTAILSAETSFEYALGVISANVIRDGSILTILWFAFSYYFKNKQWAWYDWLNVLAYTTVIASFLKPIVQEFMYQASFNPDLDRIIIAGVLVALVFGGLWFIKRNKTVGDIKLQPSLGFIKNEQGFTSIGKGIIALLVLAILSYPAYKVYDKIQLNNLIKDSANGEAFAQKRLAYRYYFGKGVPQSYSKAFALTKKSAEQGYSNAQMSLGTFYIGGKVVEEDFDKGIYWIEKAAEQENVDAQFYYAQLLLGTTLFVGNNVEQDRKKGLYYLNRAIDNGSKEAKAYKKSYRLD